MTVTDTTTPVILPDCASRIASMYRRAASPVIAWDAMTPSNRPDWPGRVPGTFTQGGQVTLADGSVWRYCAYPDARTGLRAWTQIA